MTLEQPRAYIEGGRSGCDAIGETVDPLGRYGWRRIATGRASDGPRSASGEIQADQAGCRQQARESVHAVARSPPERARLGGRHGNLLGSELFGKQDSRLGPRSRSYRDVTGLVDRVAALLHDDRQRAALAERGQSTYEARFSMEHTVATLRDGGAS